MKNQSTKAELHTLPLATAFTYRSKKFQTIVPPVTRLRCMMASKKLDVMDLKTKKVIRLPYLAKVLMFSE